MDMQEADMTHDSHMTRTVLYIEVEGVRPRGRPKQRYMDTVRLDIKKSGMVNANFLGLDDPLVWKAIQCQRDQ